MSKKARTLPWVLEKEAGANPLSPCDLSLENGSRDYVRIFGEGQ